MPWVERPLFTISCYYPIILYFVKILQHNLERNDKLNAWMKKVLVVFELKSKRFKKIVMKGMVMKLFITLCS